MTRLRHRGVAVVCTLPLPGIGSWQPAGSVACRTRQHFCWTWLHPHQALLVFHLWRARTSRLL